MKTHVQQSRRDVIRGMTAFGMSAAAGRFAQTAGPRAGAGLAAHDAMSIEKQASAFVTPLRLPGVRAQRCPQ